MFHILDIQKQPEGLSFKQSLDLTEVLQDRNPEILDLKDVFVEGQVTYENKLYVLHYDLSYELTLPSSRSMTPVVLKEHYGVDELFMEVADLKAFAGEEAEWILPIEGDSIDLSDSVADNILLNIPSKVLTKDEEASATYPGGQNWQVLSQEDYEAEKASQKEANSPFAGLSGLFDDEE